jgi:hypothetical protein
MSSICNPTYKDKDIILTDCYKEEVQLLAKNIITATKDAIKRKPTDWRYDYTTN